MDDNKKWLENILKEKSQENCIKEVLNVETKAATEKGDNYSGEIQRMITEVLLQSGKKVKRSFIIKEMPSSEYRRAIGEKVGIFKKEVLMYRDILPAMEDLMLEFGDYTEFMWGKCFYYTLYKIIISDLTADGYVIKDRKKGLDLEHCLVVMRSLAKFHAASVILKERGLIDMENYNEHVFIDDYCLELNKNFQTESFKRLADLVDTWEPEWKPVAQKIRKEIGPNIQKSMKNDLKLDENRFNVLCHGDCWINNMLFKYGLDGETPISVKFIDFQLSCYNSPAIDLKYFLTLSMNQDLRKDSILEILKVYHDSLCKELKFYSYNKKVISFEELLKEMERLTLFGISTAVNILPLMFMEKTQEIPDLEELTKELVENKNINMESWSEYFKPSLTYIKIIKSILSEAIKINKL